MWFARLFLSIYIGYLSFKEWCWWAAPIGFILSFIVTLPLQLIWMKLKYQLFPEFAIRDAKRTLGMNLDEEESELNKKGDEQTQMIGSCKECGFPAGIINLTNGICKGCNKSEGVNSENARELRERDKIALNSLDRGCDPPSARTANQQFSSTSGLFPEPKIDHLEGPDDSNIVGQPFSNVMRKWDDGCRPLAECIKQSEVSNKTYEELLLTKEGLERVENERKEKLLKTGLPEIFVHMEIPNILFESHSLTMAEKHGIKNVASAAYMGIMEGKPLEEIAVRLAFVLDLDLKSTYRFVSCIALHAKPELRNFQKPKKRGLGWMPIVLAAPFVVALVAKSVARGISSEAIGIMVAVSALLGFPVLRRFMGEKTIEHNRKNAPDGLVTLAHDDRAPVLYLRSHVVDGSGRDSDAYVSHFLQTTEMKTIEEKLCNVFYAEGPTVALEGPNEGIPNLGADRIRIEDVEKTEWQDLVLGLMARCSLIIMRFRPTEGTQWEVRELLRLIPSYQLVFVLATPNDTDEQRGATWGGLRPLLEDYATGDLPQVLGTNDYCLGFDTECRPKVFGGKGIVFGKVSAFLDAVVDAAAYGNPFFDEHKARIRSAAVA